ncbi:MAG: hypothetical protein ACOC7U_03655 [Spirochaetota bacterium]
MRIIGFLLVGFFCLADVPDVLAQQPGFMGIHIGMTRQRVLEVAEENNLIHVPRNRDVEFFPVEDRKILTFSVKPEIPFMYLQFYDERLYSLTLVFDEKKIDYLTLAGSLQEKYGEYDALEPSWRRWRRDDIIIKVEKPAVVKYVALGPLLEASGFEKKTPQEQKRKQLILQNL